MAQNMRVKSSKIENLHGLVKNYIDREWQKFKAGKSCELMEKDMTIEYYSDDGEPRYHKVTVLFVNSYFLYQYLNYHYCNDRATVEKYFSQEETCPADYRITNKTTDFDLWFLMELYREEIKSFNSMLSENKALIPIRKIPQVKKSPEQHDTYILQQDTYIFLRNPFEDESINHSSVCCCSPAVVALKNTLEHINDELNDTAAMKRYGWECLKNIADEMMMIPTSDEICQGLRQCLERELAKVPNKEIQIFRNLTNRRYHYLQKFFNIVQDSRCCDITMGNLQTMKPEEINQILERRYVFFNQFADKINLIGLYADEIWRFPTIDNHQPTFFDIINAGYVSDPIGKHMISWINDVVDMYIGGCWLDDTFTVENGFMIRTVLERYGLALHMRTEENEGSKIVYFESPHKSFMDHLDDIINMNKEAMSPWLKTELQMKYAKEYGYLVSETQRLEDYLYALLLENPETKKRYVTELQEFSFFVLLRLYWGNISVIQRIQTSNVRWNPVTVVPCERVAVELIYELFLYRYNTKSNPFEDITKVIPSKKFAEYLHKYHLCGGEYCMGHTLKDFPTINDHYVKTFIGHRVSTEPNYNRMLVALLYSICSDDNKPITATQYNITDVIKPNFQPVEKIHQLCINPANSKVYLEIPTSNEICGILTQYTNTIPDSVKATMNTYNSYIKTRSLNLENCKLLAPYIKKLAQTSETFKEALFSIDKYIFIKQVGMMKSIDGYSVAMTRTKDVDPSAILFVSYIMSEL